MKVYLAKKIRPLALGVEESAFGVASCDASAFIDLLCLHLGLPVIKEAQALTLHSLISESKDLKTFYAESFAVDPIGVSRLLCTLMDDILMNSSLDFTWSSLGEDGRIGQLASLAKALEAKNLGAILPAMNLRQAQRILQDLEIRLPWQQLILIEPRTSWSRLWRDLFVQLEAKGIEIIQRQNRTITSSRNNLSCVQRRLIDAHDTQRLAAKDDDSLFRLHGASIGEVADGVAALIAHEQTAQRSLAVVRSGESAALDAALRRQNLPSFGYNGHEHGLAPAQILPIVIEMLSGPLNPRTFKAFLATEPNPLPVGLRDALKRAIDQHGSIGTDEVEQIIQAYIARVDDPKIQERASHWREWLACGVTNQAGQLDLLHLQSAMTRIASWAERSLAISDADASTNVGYYTLLQNTRSLHDAISSDSDQTLTIIKLQSLIAEICDPALSRYHREQSQVLVSEYPDAMPHAVDTIIWWMAHDHVLPRARQSLWTASECSDLARYGVEFPDTQLEVEESYAAVRRLITSAREKFIIVTVERIGEDTMSVHPLWYEIEELFEPQQGPSTLSIEAFWTMLTRMGKTDLQHVPPAVHPTFSAAWNLDQPVEVKREYESATSIGTLLGCSLTWTFEYGAGLASRPPHQITDGYLVLGKLAHFCHQEFFSTAAWTKSAEEANLAAAQIFDKYLKSRGSILLAPGRDRDRLAAQATITESMLDLAQIMTAGNWEFVSAEATLKTNLRSFGLEGRADLVFQRKQRSSESLIVDLKYTQSKRDDELKHGRSTQLASYSRLLKNGDQWPKTAYYIMASKQLLTVHKDIAPNLYPIAGDTEAYVWERVEAMVAKTYRQISAGTIELGIDTRNNAELQQSDRLIPAPCKYCQHRLFCRMPKGEP